VAAAQCPPGKAQKFYWDTLQPALGLRVTANQSKAFIFEAKLGGRSIRVTIGPADLQIRGVKTPYRFGADLEAARLAGQVAQGIDPRAARAALIDAQEGARQVARVEREKLDVTGLAAWLAYIEDRRADWGDRHHQDHIKMAAAGGLPRARSRVALTVDGPLRSLLDQPLATIGSKEVAAWLKAQSAVRPTQARLAFRMTSAFLNWCGESDEFRDIVQADAHLAKAVRRAVPKARTRSDCLQREMLRPWFAAVRQESPMMAAVLQTMLLTGARPGEVMQMEWADVDFGWQGVTIRDKVAGRRTIPLTRYVAGLLQGLKASKATESPFVFAGRGAGQRVTDPSGAHARALARAGLPAVTLHGLRRSFSTLGEWAEIPSGIAAQLQGHKPSATIERSYKVRPQDLLRLWAQKFEDFVLNEAGISPVAAHLPARPALALVQK
jgi:integrase